MKAFLILWGMSLAACDKLDRTYLPPPGSITSGGHLDDLNLPLEFPKETYSSTLKPENDRKILNNFTKSNYPNVAIGIDREGASVAPTESLVTVSGDFGKKIGISPSTTKPYHSFTQTSTSSPIENYEATTRSAATNQGYTSTMSPFVQNYNYPHQIVNELEHPSISFNSEVSRVIPQTVYTGQSFTYSNISPKLQPMQHVEQIQHNFDIGFVKGHAAPTSSSLTPQDDSTAHYPSNQYEGKFDTPSSMVTSDVSTIPASYYDSNPETYGSFDGENSSYPSKNIDETSKLIPNIYAEGVSSTSAPIKSSSVYSTAPKYYSENSGSNYNAPIQPERPQAAADRNGLIINYENILTPQGFAYSYDTSNGIHAEESGTAENGVKAQGSYSYIGDDGQVYNIAYTADENGFLPRGDHLPTAPPIPDAILKVIEGAEKNRKLGVIDDGTYDDSKYGDARYQGSFGRKSPAQYSNTYKEQPINREYMPSTKTISNGNKDSPAIDGNTLDQFNISGQFNKISRRPYSSYSENGIGDDDYKNEEARDLSTNDANQSNDREVPEIYEGKAEDYGFVNRPINKSINNSETIYGLPEGHYVDYTSNTPKTGITLSSNNKVRYGSEDLPANRNIHIPKEQVTSHIAGHDIKVNMASHTGYDYTRPLHTFNVNHENNYQSDFLNPIKETTKPSDGVINNQQIITNTFVTPKVQTSKLPPSQQLSRHPITIFDRKNTIRGQNVNNGLVQPGFASFSNGVLEKSDAEPNVGTDRIFQSTSTPKYGSTLSSYQYPYRATVSGNDRQSNYYPTSTPNTDYVSSTTPLPSESSSLPTSSIGLDYIGITPTVSQFSSTARAKVGPKFFGTTTHRPGNTVRSEFKQKPDKFDRISATSQDITLDGSNEKHIYRGKPRIPGTNNKGQEFVQEIPQGNPSKDGMIPGFGIPDYTTENLKIFSGRRNYEDQSSTERVIGEDFSGPKQPQKFDPVHGYYY